MVTIEPRSAGLNASGPTRSSVRSAGPTCAGLPWTPGFVRSSASSTRRTRNDQTPHSTGVICSLRLRKRTIEAQQPVHNAMGERNLDAERQPRCQQGRGQLNDQTRPPQSRCTPHHLRLLDRKLRTRRRLEPPKRVRQPSLGDSTRLSNRSRRTCLELSRGSESKGPASASGPGVALSSSSSRVSRFKMRVSLLTLIGSHSRRPRRALP